MNDVLTACGIPLVVVSVTASMIYCIVLLVEYGDAREEDELIGDYLRRVISRDVANAAPDVVSVARQIRSLIIPSPKTKRKNDAVAKESGDDNYDPYANGSAS